MDANVPLFGVRFTILFIVCLILFLILVPFNVILLFTRTLSRFRFINRFKPLLDAYQGPYKTNYYYYTGVQLLLRAMFFAISSLERNINLVLSIVILSLIIFIQGAINPLKNKVKNFQEMVYIINLQMLNVMALYDDQVVSDIAFSVLFGLAAFHFAFIVTYHIITYSCSNMIKTKLTAMKGWITLLATFYNSENVELQDFNMRNVIPDAVNYHEYRETLLNENYNY